MPKQKLKLTDYSFDFNFSVLAIVSQSRDYHLCWQINRELNINLKRENDLQLNDNKKKQVTYFSYFSFTDISGMSRYNLVANKSGNDFFLSEVKVADFLLTISEIEREELKKILFSLKKLTQVIAVSELEVDKLKSKKNLIFE